MTHRRLWRKLLVLHEKTEHSWLNEDAILAALSLTFRVQWGFFFKFFFRNWLHFREREREINNKGCFSMNPPLYVNQIFIYRGRETHPARQKRKWTILFFTSRCSDAVVHPTVLSWNESEALVKAHKSELLHPSSNQMKSLKMKNDREWGFSKYPQYPCNTACVCKNTCNTHTLYTHFVVYLL